MQKDKPWDGWTLKTINPGDECFYVTGGDGYTFEDGVVTSLSSDSVTGLFKAPADSIFDKSSYTPKNINIESVIQWPDGLTSLSHRCFSNCSELISINIPTTITSIGHGCFQNCPKLTSVIIPNGVDSLKNFIFSGCSELISVDLPASISSIGRYCFENCTKLISVAFHGTTVPVYNTNDYAFYGVSSSLIIHVPSNYQGDTFGGRTVTKDLPAA